MTKRSGLLLFAIIIGFGLILVVGPLVASALDDPNRTGIDPDAVGLPSITYDQNGQTYHMSVNQGFLLNLGADYTWVVTIDNQAVVRQDLNVSVGLNVQGIYQAVSAGKAVLSAVGKPNCPSANLSCNQAERAFQINIVVE